MSPFDLAQSMGFGKKDILKFLSKANPQISEGLTKAVGLGYSSDQVFQFLSKSLAGSKVDPRMSRRVFGDPNAASMMRRAQNAPQQQSAGQVPVIGGLVGAGVGFATGGPVGALIGGAAGYNQLNKLSKAYEDHIQGGGSIPFASFITELAKGSAVAGLSAAQIGKLKDAAKGYLSATGEEGGSQAQELTAGEEPQGAVTPPEEAVQPPMAEAPQEGVTPPPLNEQTPVEEIATEAVFEEEPGGPDILGQESYNLMKGKGLNKFIDLFSTQISPEEGGRRLESLFGKQYVKGIEKQSKKPIEQVLSEAFDYAKSRGGVGEDSTFIERSMEGLSFKDLPRPVQNRLRLINQQIASLENRGEEYDSKRVQRLLKQRDKFLKGEGLGIAEQEEIRMEKSAPIEKAPPMEESQRNAFMEIFKKTPGEAEPVKGRIKPIPGSQKSSNVIGTFYDPDKKEMRAVFGSGTVYSYPNVEMEDFESVTGGKARPITEGENMLGFWHRKKDPSVGASFDKFIKKQSDKYPHQKLEPEQYTATENQILTAKRTFQASDLFEPFQQQRKRGRQVEKGKALREMEPVLKEIDDEFLGDIVGFIEEQLKDKLKNPPKMGRLQKEFRKEFL